MTQSTPESGIAPLVIGGVTVAYNTIFWTVANVGLTAYQINSIWGTQDNAVEEAEATARQEDLKACLEAYGDVGGMTPGARSLYIQELDNWRAFASNELAGDTVKTATVNATIDKLAGLYAQEMDPAGLPVGPCHVLAGTFIILRQVEAMKSEAPSEEETESDQNTLVAHPPTPPPSKIAMAAALIGFAALTYLLLR